MKKYIIIKFLNIKDKQTKFIIFINIIVLLFLLNIWDYSYKNLLESKIIRYIKHKKKNILSCKEYEKEIYNIKKYIYYLKNNFLKKIKYNFNITKPKVSFISSVYNKELYLNSFIFSIQNQNLKNFELILVDDFSNDRSIEIIEEFKKNDTRIKLIKNKKNRGTLYSRYNGALYSKGEYIIFVDSDDIVLKKGIINAYSYMKKKKLDMVEFHSVFEINSSVSYVSRRYSKYSNIIYQPILSYIYYYSNKEGMELNTALWDKLIKREVVFKSINYMGIQYLNDEIIIENDVIILFSLFRNANSFQYIDELGYYYFIKNNDSITNTRYDPRKANKIIHSIFSNVKFLYEKTEDSYFDKYFCIYKLLQGYNRYKFCFNYINNEYELMKNVFNKLLNSKYISLEKKLIIKNIKDEIFMNRTLKINKR
jgi:glycosyltransferase involved in cell wall biosynthesis